MFKDGEFLDTIEGPETEIKCICLSEDNSFLAMSTRGRTVWICKIRDSEIEVDAVLEDHLHDVKGVKFHRDRLYSFGYDNTIKVYERFNLDESWDMIQSLEEDSTVWNVEFSEELMVSCNEDGRVRLYVFSWEWTLARVLDASVYPIYSVVFAGGCICYILNRSNVAVLDVDLRVLGTVSLSCEINCLYFCKHRNALLCGLDSGTIEVVEIDQ